MAYGVHPRLAEQIMDAIERELYPPAIMRTVEFRIHDEVVVSSEPSRPAHMNPLLLLTTT